VPNFIIQPAPNNKTLLTTISRLDIITISNLDATKWNIGGPMEDKIRRIYVPMTETGFYILFCLQKPQHGYGIGQRVKEMTGSEVTISPGTMYGTLSKMEKDGLITFLREEDKRKLYQISPLGREVLDTELRRIERLYKNSQEDLSHG
jgi:DNA-binding PadR family transcriptional regulator